MPANWSDLLKQRPAALVPPKPLAGPPEPYPRIPDAFLAQSRARVEAAARNRR
mgnify:CR=1 FL=1